VKVVIAGHAKSGTTALFYTIKRALPPETRCLFEPLSFEPGHDAFVLAKVLTSARLHVDFEAFKDFDHKILIVRDPRDIAVSRTLYAIYDVANLLDDVRVEAFIEALERKEWNARSVSLRELWEIVSGFLERDFQAGFIANQEAFLTFERTHPDYMVFHYEDLVASELGPLERYLGLRLPRNVTVDAGHQRVERAKTSGDWRHWLTPADVTWLEPICRKAICHFGYSHDWTLASQPLIRPEHASLYVKRIVEERRQSS
jgi:hypothetical protein